MSSRIEHNSALERLEKDGLAISDGDRYVTSRRWQGAMARAALRLYEAGDPGDDLRVPVAAALIDLYGSQLSDEELATLVEAALPIEAASLGLMRQAR
jgi:hypothetical protein